MSSFSSAPAIDFYEDLTKGSMTVGDYQDKIGNSPKSCVFDENYHPINTSNKYQELQDLILSWMKEEGDEQEWQEIENAIKKVNLPHDK